jgi:hypothetical protein
MFPHFLPQTHQQKTCDETDRAGWKNAGKRGEKVFYFYFLWRVRGMWCNFKILWTS